MFELFMPEIKTSYTRKEAIRAIKRLEKSGKKHTLHDFAKLYDDDFEDVFREAVGEIGIETYAFDLERHITKGTEWAGNFTNGLQRDIWDFKVYSLVLYMKDRNLMLPVSLLDNELVDELNKAAKDFGYKALYRTHNPLRVCVNPAKKVNICKLDLSEEEVEMIEKARKECDAYIKKSEKINEEKYEAEREEIDYGELPHWMKVVHEQYMQECDEEE